jgi:hypothetical protein
LFYTFTGITLARSTLLAHFSSLLNKTPFSANRTSFNRQVDELDEIISALDWLDYEEHLIGIAFAAQNFGRIPKHGPNEVNIS